MLYIAYAIVTIKVVASWGESRPRYGRLREPNSPLKAMPITGNRSTRVRAITEHVPGSSLLSACANGAAGSTSSVRAACTRERLRYVPTDVMTQAAQARIPIEQRFD